MMFVVHSLLWLISSVFCISSAQSDTSELGVTFEDVIVILSELHDPWPPLSTPPPSNISGLTADECYGSADCVEPRVCFSCSSLPCTCFKAPRYANFSCNSSKDCDEGEYCEWDASIGKLSGLCLSSKSFQGESRPILTQPLDSLPSLLGSGLTGDRCFSHQDCRGNRSCLSETIIPEEVYNITSCENSSFNCVCTPLNFVHCTDSSSCNNDEVCASVMFPLFLAFSYRSVEREQMAILESICMSLNLSRHDNVFPVAENSSFLDFAGLKTAKLHVPSTQENNLSQSFPSAGADAAHFTVPALTFFNSFSTNELANEFISGILSLIIVSQLQDIVEGLLHLFPRIDHNAYSSFITFSRLRSFRFVFRLFTTREPFPGSTAIQSSIRTSHIRYKLLFRSLFALIFLYAVELGTILAGTSVRSEHYADHNFDTIVAPVRGTPRPRIPDEFNRYCDQFFVSTRGLFEYGKVLKCVKPFSKEPDAAQQDIIRVLVLYGSGKTVFEVFSQNGSYSAVELSTYLRSTSGETMRTMPFRPDLMHRQDRFLFLNNMLNMVRGRLGLDAIDVRSPVWSTLQQVSTLGRVETIEFGHRPNWNESVETITNAVILGLRDMDLVLNSSGRPWIYTKPYTFEQRNALMAVVKPHRFSQGWLLLCAALISIVHILLNSFVTHFAEVAYIAMKELMADDCVLGPLAESCSTATEVDLRS
eukprot:TRINITY_DN30394_c0_g1_i1.p1 TRINITY_DN30394_c0_g1~~TRINITY_DN30394_c0_g1_i1.p1  ORF type:complete len:704 (-),score=46.16 TRINITY_DN30394_c0_g1_i1:161-2272(-)